MKPYIVIVYWVYRDTTKNKNIYCRAGIVQCAESEMDATAKAVTGKRVLMLDNGDLLPVNIERCTLIAWRVWSHVEANHIAFKRMLRRNWLREMASDLGRSDALQSSLTRQHGLAMVHDVLSHGARKVVIYNPMIEVLHVPQDEVKP